MSNLPGGDEAATTRDETPEEAAARHEAASKEAADTVMKAFGGVRGMVDMTLPGLVFIVTFNVTHAVSAATWAALGLSGILAVVRLARRETIQHAFSGVFGVAIGAYIAMKSGKAENFYLPGLLYSVGYCAALALSALARWPLIGIMLGPITGEMFTWRKQNPGRLAAYTRATWVWFACMAVKPVVLFPLYFAHNANLLGWVKVALGIPPMLVAMYFTWQILIKAPAPIKAVFDDDDEQDGGGHPTPAPAPAAASHRARHAAPTSEYWTRTGGRGGRGRMAPPPSAVPCGQPGGWSASADSRSSSWSSRSWAATNSSSSPASSVSSSLGTSTRPSRMMVTRAVSSGQATSPTRVPTSCGVVRAGSARPGWRRPG